MNLDRRFRPKSFDEIIGNKGIKRDMKAFIATGDPPHMMLIGPPGCGKNTLAYNFATEYLGRPISVDTEEKDSDYRELNASKERGIDTVREVIADFAECASNTYGKDGRLLKRIIFLDEFDSTTKAYQMALKSIMEKTERNCIFILSMNEEQGVFVDALFSRCKVFRMKRPHPKDIAEYFMNTAKKVNVMFEDTKLIEDIVRFYKGDMRRMLVDCLESLRGYFDKRQEDGTILISKEDLYHIYENDTTDLAKKIFKSEHPRTEFMKIWERENFNVRSFLKDYFELYKGHSADIFAKVDSRLRRGANPMIQMNYLFSQIGL